MVGLLLKELKARKLQGSTLDPTRRKLRRQCDLRTYHPGTPVERQ